MTECCRNIPKQPAIVTKKNGLKSSSGTATTTAANIFENDSLKKRTYIILQNTGLIDLYYGDEENQNQVIYSKEKTDMIPLHHTFGVWVKTAADTCTYSVIEV